MKRKYLYYGLAIFTVPLVIVTVALWMKGDEIEPEAPNQSPLPSDQDFQLLKTRLRETLEQEHPAVDDHQERRRCRRLPCSVTATLDSHGPVEIEEVGLAGLRLASQAELKPSQQVVLRPSPGDTPVKATVVWCDDGKVGLEYGAGVESNTWLLRLLLEAGFDQAALVERRNWLRMEVACRAEVKNSSGERSSVELVNLSLEGAYVTGQVPDVSDGRVRLLLTRSDWASGLSLPGRLVASHDGEHHIHFLNLNKKLVERLSGFLQVSVSLGEPESEGD